MALTKKPVYIHEPTDLQCGQAVLAMLSDKTVDEIIDLVGTDRETTLRQMFDALTALGIGYEPSKIAVNKKEELPQIAMLSLETPRCWHWSLYFEGTFFDPEHGIMNDFPVSNRKYYWGIIQEEKNYETII